MRSVLRSFVALLLLLAVACGSDGKEAADKGSTTTTTIKVLKAGEVDAKASAYCGVWAQIRGLVPAKLTGTDADVQARKDFYAKVVPLAEKLVSSADADIEDAARFALAQAKELAASGTEAPQTAKDKEMQRTLGQYALDHCAKGS
jgi:hypothetical protein